MNRLYDMLYRILYKEKMICHPMTLYIFSLEAEYDKVRKLKQMIDSEHLLLDYTINRQFNRFYLQ